MGTEQMSVREAFFIFVLFLFLATTENGANKKQQGEKNSLAQPQ